MGTGYTSISDYLSANRGTVGREQDDLARDVSSQVAGARTAADNVAHGVQPGSDWTQAPGYGDALAHGIAAQQSGQLLGDQSGISTLLQHEYASDPQYTKGKGDFDASLLVGRQPFRDVADQAKSLSGYLDGLGATAAAAPAAPVGHVHPWDGPPPLPEADPEGPHKGNGPWAPTPTRRPLPANPDDDEDQTLKFAQGGA